MKTVLILATMLIASTCDLAAQGSVSLDSSAVSNYVSIDRSGNPYAGT